MAAAATKTDATSATTTVVKVEHPDRFFGRVRTCLKANQLPQALEILRLGNSSIHRNLVPGNIEKVADFISVEKETPEKTAGVRCSRLTKIMEQHFPDVFQLEMIKKKGLEAGLSEKEVEASLEHVALKDGSFWMIMETGPDFHRWQNSLVGFAGNSKMNLWSEKCIRTSERELERVKALSTCSSRGLFRGLANLQFIHWTYLVPFYHTMFESLCFFNRFNPMKDASPTKDHLKEQIKQLCTPYLTTLIKETIKNRTIFVTSLGKTTEQSELASSLIFDIVQISEHSKLHLVNCEKMAAQIVAQEPNIEDWCLFLEAHLPNVFADCSQEVQEALKGFISAGKQYREIIGKEMSDGKGLPVKIHYQAYPQLKNAYEKFQAAFSPVRDAIFANSFLSEWSNRNKDVISVVQVSACNAEGFKREVVARQEGKAESKDEKKKENSEKADGKADSKLK